METTTKPSVWVAKLDQTAFYCPEFLQKLEAVVGQPIRLLSVYLYDERSHTHCCEITASYDLHFVEIQISAIPEDDDQREIVFNMLQEAADDCEISEYYHVRNIDKLPTEQSDNKSHRYELGEYDDMEEALEYARGNQV